MAKQPEQAPQDSPEQADAGVGRPANRGSNSTLPVEGAAAGAAPGATDEHGRWHADGVATEPYAITLYPRQIQAWEGIRPDISRPDDWRNADIIFRLDGARVRSADGSFNSHTGAVEPDWSEYDTYLQWNDNSRQPINLGRDPAPVFKQALLEGRVLYGVIIARDEQFHG